MGAERTDATLIICAHNPRPEYFGRVLAAIREQTLPKGSWELIIVDNLSAAPLAPNWDLSWHPRGRHVLESELGLAAARRRAIREAASDLLVFVDDDNILDPNYLSEAIKVGREYPFLGVWGSGALIPEFEIQPEEQVKEFLPYLALRDTKVASWTNALPCPEATPWGAGLCVRSKVAKAYCDYCERSKVRISGRRGKALLSGEEIEICYVASDIGLSIGIFPQLRLIHMIPKERVSLDYLLKIYEGTITSELLLDYNWHGRDPKPVVKTRSLLWLLKVFLLFRGVGRKRQLANRRAAIAATKIISSSRARR